MPAHRAHPTPRLALQLAALVAAAGCATASPPPPAPAPPGGTAPAPSQPPSQPSTEPLPSCFVPPPCDAAPPPAGTAAGFRKTSSTLKASVGKANHRVHDLVLAPSDAQWVIGTFAYDGVSTGNLEGEDVDVHLLRGCGQTWEHLGTARTTDDGEHATVEGVADTGGHVYLEIPADRALGVGRHRLRLVVRGDLTAAEGFIEVQPAGAALLVSDVDGTLTPSDLSEVGGILTGTIPDANPGAAAALGRLAAAGYRPVYLTARTESEVRRTREFLAARGFPPGVVRTTQGDGLIGLTGAAATRFKAGELALVQGHGFQVALGIGNTESDAQAYQQAGIAASFLLGTDAGAPYGAERFDEYATLVERAALPALCAGP
jgi:hypothetical protein